MLENDDGYDLGPPLLSASIGERRIVIRYRRRFDHLWLCEEEANRRPRFHALDAVAAAWRVGDSAGGRYVIGGRASRQAPPGLTDVRARLGSGETVFASVKHPAWLIVLPEGVRESEVVQLSWHLPDGRPQEADLGPFTLSEMLGDGGSTHYALLRGSEPR